MVYMETDSFIDSAAILKCVSSLMRIIEKLFQGNSSSGLENRN
jgi:hypothetical protein